MNELFGFSISFLLWNNSCAPFFNYFFFTGRRRRFWQTRQRWFPGKYQSLDLFWSSRIVCSLLFGQIQGLSVFKIAVYGSCSKTCGKFWFFDVCLFKQHTLRQTKAFVPWLAFGYELPFVVSFCFLRFISCVLRNYGNKPYQCQSSRREGHEITVWHLIKQEKKTK